MFLIYITNHISKERDGNDVKESGGLAECQAWNAELRLKQGGDKKKFFFPVDRGIQFGNASTNIVLPLFSSSESIFVNEIHFFSKLVLGLFTSGPPMRVSFWSTRKNDMMGEFDVLVTRPRKGRGAVTQTPD